MKTYLKTLWRTFEKHIARFLSIVLIVVVAVGFCSGIGSSSDNIRDSLNAFYKSAHVSDFIVKDKTGDGFSDEDIENLEQRYGEGNVRALTTLDVYLGEGEESELTRLYFLDFEKWDINVPENSTLSGKMPEDKGQALAEKSDKKIRGFEEGEVFTLDFAELLKALAEDGGEELENEEYIEKLPAAEVKISGSAQGVLTFGEDGEPSYKNPEDVKIPDTTNGVDELICLDNAIYLSSDIIPTYRDLIEIIIADQIKNLPASMHDTVFDMAAERLGLNPDEKLISPALDLWICAPDRSTFGCFSGAYKSYTDQENQYISDFFGKENVRVLTLYDNYSFNALNSYADKVEAIGYVLMAAFLFVTSLVVLSTMTRFLDEERGQIACLMTQGYSRVRILFKYILFAAVATGAGGVGAFFIGLALSNLIYWVFGYSFTMPPRTLAVTPVFFLVTFAVIVVTTLGATFLSGIKMTGEKPANLLRPKPPKAGKKVIVERIPFIWNRLSFKYKSTTRNVLRYKSRFIMTVFAVAISMALVMAGLSLLDICLFRGMGSTSILLISIVIVIFAGLLTMVVIYTLTNINISERKRELATLMVLGYYDGEVAGYIYREIFIDAAIGIIFGYPLSAAIMAFLFSIMAAGTFATFMWAVAPVVIMVFTGLVALLLRHKIVKIDMNESLKSTE